MATAVSEEKHLKSIKGIMLSTNLDGTEAYLKLVETELAGESLTFETITGFLEEAGVTFGVQHELIKKLANSPVYGERVLVAKGLSPQGGKDCIIDFLFNTGENTGPTVDQKGSINYKELNYIQSAKAGQVLARKTPVTPGIPGKSVLGKEIAAKSGHDWPISRGANTELSADGLSVTASIDGSIIFKSNAVSVQPSQTIPGSIDSSTGNIKCLGSLKVGKNISSEFKLDVAGDLEVGGNVEDATLDVGGSVLIRGGFCGGGRGLITAKGDVTVKYVENQKIRSEGSVYIGGEVLNCDIYAGDNVVVQGKSGRIAGGNIGAKHLIRVATLGNEAAVATHVHVAYDMKTVERLREVTKVLERLTNDEKRVKDAMVVLYRLELNGKLPADKKEALGQFKQFMKEIPSQKERLVKEQDELKLRLQELTGARVVVEEQVFVGAVIHFGPVYKEIQEDIKGGAVFDKTGDTITRGSFDPERERRLDEQWKKTRKEQEAAAEPAHTAVNS